MRPHGAIALEVRGGRSLRRDSLLGPADRRRVLSGISAGDIEAVVLRDFLRERGTSLPHTPRTLCAGTRWKAVAGGRRDLHRRAPPDSPASGRGTDWPPARGPGGAPVTLWLPRRVRAVPNISP